MGKEKLMTPPRFSFCVSQFYDHRAAFGTMDRRRRSGFMVKHYSYRVDHDVGFAPYLVGDIAIVCGCKSSTIERWAEPGTWLVGIGGNGTGKPDAIIYAMRVDYTPSFGEFAGRWPTESERHNSMGTDPDVPVLVSEHFYYFGDKALKLPKSLSHLVIRAQGCKRIDDKDVATLRRFLAQRGKPGAYGVPNNEPVFSEARITRTATERCRMSRRKC